MYVEPEDYFPKEIREKYKLGEYNTDEEEDKQAEKLSSNDPGEIEK